MAPSPFLPPLLPLSPDEDNWGHFGRLEFDAVRDLSTLNGMMQASAKADLFWLTWLLKEAQSSNVIEGTITTFDEILKANIGVPAPVARQDAVREVVNYRNAMQVGLAEVEKGRPFSLSFVKSLHAILLEGTRGSDKRSGQWRTIQVHIGTPCSSMESATYIPPEPFHVVPLLENWETFIHREDLNPIIQAAILHAQFEMIHPFVDGNGRMGRLLITLFLAYKRITTKRCFYISEYLQERRDIYYKLLHNISKFGDWENWIKFFLHAVCERSKNNSLLLKNMSELYERSKIIVQETIKTKNFMFILDYMFAHPLFTIPGFLKGTGTNMSNQGVKNILAKLEQVGIVEKVSEGKGRSAALWKFKDVMSLLERF